jgi:4'-phosphopantetheinyl transferase
VNLPQELQPNQVHFWVIPLDRDPDRVQAYYRYLSGDERKRADRFHFDRHRRRFAVSHNALREILGGYLGAQPEAIQFDHTDHGKPWLSGPFKGSGVHFNLSHSHELALAAFTLEGEVGVDLEYIKIFGDMDGIARRYFSAVEQAAYLALPEEHKPLGFFNCWTRKEAFIKAIGEGLSHPLHQFDVTLHPGEPATFLRIGDDPEEAAHWTLEALQPGDDYIGSLALRARGVEIINFQFGN